MQDEPMLKSIQNSLRFASSGLKSLSDNKVNTHGKDAEKLQQLKSTVFFNTYLSAFKKCSYAGKCENSGKEKRFRLALSKNP